MIPFMLFSLYYLGLEHSKDPNCRPYPQHTAPYLGKPKQTNWTLLCLLYLFFYICCVYQGKFLLQIISTTRRSNFSRIFHANLNVNFKNFIEKKLVCQILVSQFWRRILSELLGEKKLNFEFFSQKKRNFIRYHYQ